MNKTKKYLRFGFYNQLDSRTKLSIANYGKDFKSFIYFYLSDTNGKPNGNILVEFADIDSFTNDLHTHLKNHKDYVSSIYTDKKTWLIEFKLPSKEMFDSFINSNYSQIYSPGLINLFNSKNMLTKELDEKTGSVSDYHVLTASDLGKEFIANRYGVSIDFIDELDEAIDIDKEIYKINNG